MGHVFRSVIERGTGGQIWPLRLPGGVAKLDSSRFRERQRGRKGTIYESGHLFARQNLEMLAGK